MEAKVLFADEFLEEMADMGIEVTDLFEIMHNSFVRRRNHRKLRAVMRNYPSAFDRLAARR